MKVSERVSESGDGEEWSLEDQPGARPACPSPPRPFSLLAGCRLRCDLRDLDFHCGMGEIKNGTIFFVFHFFFFFFTIFLIICTFPGEEF